MDYEAIDRDMSSWLVTSTRNNTRFFLTDDGVATDILSRARRYRWYDIAEEAATRANDEYAWQGFDWFAMSVPEAYNTRKNAQRATSWWCKNCCRMISKFIIKCRRCP